MPPSNHILYNLSAIFLGVTFALSCNSQTFLVGGNAVNTGNDCYTLTQALGNQLGYVYNNTAINLNDTFDMTVQVNLGSIDGNGADGMCFLMRGALTSPYTGSSGGSLGYETLNGASIAIEFDTYQNGGYGDPVFDHIAILKNGSVTHTSPDNLAGPVQAAPGSANIEDGGYHVMRITWDPSAQVFAVYFDCEARLSYTGNIIDSIFGGNPQVYWGFTGATGGLSNEQKFCFTSPLSSLYVALQDTNMCQGDAFQFDAGSGIPSFIWSPSASLDDASIHNPTASPSTTTSYFVTATHLCDTLYDTATIQVTPPPFTLDLDTVQVTCKGACDGELIPIVTGSTQGISYHWDNGIFADTLTALCADTYALTVSNLNGCALSASGIITEPLALSAQILNPSKTSCPGVTACNASAVGSAIGGTPPYSFIWSTGEIGDSATHLCPDTNWLTVTDAKGCISETFVRIKIPLPIETFGFGDTLICVSNHANIIATSTGGTPPYFYTWRKNSLNGPLVSTNQIESVDPQESTVYFVSSIDSNACPGDTAQVRIDVRPMLGNAFAPIDTICPYDTIRIHAQGEGGDSTYHYFWEGGQSGASILTSPDQSTYVYVTVTDVCGSTPFADSLFVQVGGYPSIKSTINADDDTICAGEVVGLTANAVGGFHGPAEFKYEWAHQANGDFCTVSPVKTTTYYVTISDLCLSEPGVGSITVYAGAYETPSYTLEPSTVCVGMPALLAIDNYRPSSTYNLYLDGASFHFGLGSDPIPLREIPVGCHNISLEAITEFNCKSEKSLDCAFKVNPLPVAAFDNEPAMPSLSDPIVEFSDKSLAAESIAWYFNGVPRSHERVISEFFSEDIVEVTLVATHESGCIDSISKSIELQRPPTLYIPNAFTPNNDGVNDFFGVAGENISEEGFELKIFDRWGEPIFQSSSPAQKWDGRLNGKKLNPGIYPYFGHFRDIHGEIEYFQGQVTIAAPRD